MSEKDILIHKLKTRCEALGDSNSLLNQRLRDLQVMYNKLRAKTEGKKEVKVKGEISEKQRGLMLRALGVAREGHPVWRNYYSVRPECAEFTELTALVKMGLMKVMEENVRGYHIFYVTEMGKAEVLGYRRQKGK